MDYIHNNSREERRQTINGQILIFFPVDVYQNKVNYIYMCVCVCVYIYIHM